MMLHDYDIILVTSQYSKLSHLENRTRIIYPCGPFKHTIVECCVKKSAHSAQNSGRAVLIQFTNWIVSFSGSWQIVIIDLQCLSTLNLKLVTPNWTVSAVWCPANASNIIHYCYSTWLWSVIH